MQQICRICYSHFFSIAFQLLLFIYFKLQTNDACQIRFQSAIQNQYTNANPEQTVTEGLVKKYSEVKNIIEGKQSSK